MEYWEEIKSNMPNAYDIFIKRYGQEIDVDELGCLCNFFSAEKIGIDMEYAHDFHWKITIEEKESCNVFSFIEKFSSEKEAKIDALLKGMNILEKKYLTGFHCITKKE